MNSMDRNTTYQYKEIFSTFLVGFINKNKNSSFFINVMILTIKKSIYLIY